MVLQVLNTEKSEAEVARTFDAHPAMVLTCSCANARSGLEWMPGIDYRDGNGTMSPDLQPLVS